MLVWISSQCAHLEPSSPIRSSRVNRAHPSSTIVFKRLMNFCFGVHHERSIAGDWFIQRHTSDEQYFERGFRVGRVLNSHFIAVGREHDHLSVSTTLTF